MQQVIGVNCIIPLIYSIIIMLTAHWCSDRILVSGILCSFLGLLGESTNSTEKLYKWLAIHKQCIKQGHTSSAVRWTVWGMHWMQAVWASKSIPLAAHRHLSASIRVLLLDVLSIVIPMIYRL